MKKENLISIIYSIVLITIIGGIFFIDYKCIKPFINISRNIYKEKMIFSLVSIFIVNSSFLFILSTINKMRLTELEILKKQN